MLQYFFLILDPSTVSSRLVTALTNPQRPRQSTGSQLSTKIPRHSFELKCTDEAVQSLGTTSTGLQVQSSRPFSWHVDEKLDRMSPLFINSLSPYCRYRSTDAVQWPRASSVPNPLLLPLLLLHPSPSLFSPTPPPTPSLNLYLLDLAPLLTTGRSPRHLLGHFPQATRINDQGWCGTLVTNRKPALLSPSEPHALPPQVWPVTPRGPICWLTFTVVFVRVRVPSTECGTRAELNIWRPPTISLDPLSGVWCRSSMGALAGCWHPGFSRAPCLARALLSLFWCLLFLQI